MKMKDKPLELQVITTPVSYYIFIQAYLLF
jgi:hypothetical protein